MMQHLFFFLQWQKRHKITHKNWKRLKRLTEGSRKLLSLVLWGFWKNQLFFFIGTLTSPYLFIIHVNPCNVDDKLRCKGGIKIQSSPVNPLHPSFTLELTAKNATLSLFNLALMSVMIAIQQPEDCSLLMVHFTCMMAGKVRFVFILLILHKNILWD